MPVDAGEVADVVLSCVLVEEGVGQGGMSTGGSFTRTPATLVLRDVAVASDESLDTLTPFVPPSVPDPDLIIIEATVSSPEIPKSDVLLHADCNELEVMCEMSRYSPSGSEKGTDPAYFMVSLSIDAMEFSTALILQIVEKEQSALRQSKLGLPLSPSGTVQTEVIFLVFTHVKSVTVPLRGDVLLHCGFKQQDVPLAQDINIGWRVQHRGRGRKVFDMKTTVDGAEGSTVVHMERSGSTVSALQVVSEGNASLSLTGLKVADEGTYICTVTIGQFHAQQVVQLQIIQLPQVSLSDDRLVLKSAKTLSCHSSKYYPLDTQIEWFSHGPTDTEPIAFADQGSLSSHRQHSDGTFSKSSHLTLPAGITPGTKITCVVSHPAQDAPVSVSVTVETPEPDSYWWVLGFLIVTVLFFYQVMK